MSFHAPSPSASEIPVACVRFWHGGCPVFGARGVPQRWVNLPGNARPTGEGLAASWSLDNGPEAHLELGPGPFRLAAPGDFNIEVPVDTLTRGPHRATVYLRRGGRTLASAEQAFEFEPREPAAFPYVADPARAGSLDAFAQVVDGNWEFGPDGARSRAMGYDRILAFGDRRWVSYELVARFTLHGFEDTHPGHPQATGPGVGFLTRWTGHFSDGHQPSTQWRPCGVLGWYRYGRDRADRVRDFRFCLMAGDTSAPDLSGLLTEDFSGFRLEPGVPHMLRMRVADRPGRTARYSLRAWPAAAREPREWLLEADGLPCETPSGSIAFVSHHTDATLHELRVTRCGKSEI